MWSVCNHAMQSEAMFTLTTKVKKYKQSTKNQMELFYLLCSILSTFFTSLTLSLLLPFHTLLNRHRSSRATTSSSNNEPNQFSLYQGTVWHERRRPVHHSFNYPVRYALIHLDHELHAPPDHLSADKARQFAYTTGPVYIF